MTLPTFLVIGAMKAGTSSLWEYLRAHPDVHLPLPKELDFFVEGKAWERGIDWYRGKFAEAGGAVAVGEASTNYTKHPMFPGVPERIAEVVPDVRLVYLVRHPLERIRSQYVHSLGAGWARRSLDREVRADAQYVDISRYAAQLDRYTPHFAREQILVVTAEALRDDRQATVDRVLAHIGVSPGPALPLDRVAHTSAERSVPRRGGAVVDRVSGLSAVRRIVPAGVRRAWGAATALDHPRRLRLSPSTESWLLDELRPDVARLRDWVGPDFDGWGIG